MSDLHAACCCQQCAALLCKSLKRLLAVMACCQVHKCIRKSAQELLRLVQIVPRQVEDLFRKYSLCAKDFSLKCRKTSWLGYGGSESSTGMYSAVNSTMYLG